MNSKIIILLFFIISLSSCYYDSEAKLYPNPPACDTLNVSYSSGILPILQNKCYSCHSNNVSGSVIKFEGYAALIEVMATRNFLGAIKRESGVVAMPQGGEKLPDCEINTIQAWVTQGEKNN